MNFENLFGGDKLLGTTMNQFLNENWQDILNELKPVLRKAIAKIVKGIVNPVFGKFAYNDLFLPWSKSNVMMKTKQNHAFWCNIWKL